MNDWIAKMKIDKCFICQNVVEVINVTATRGNDDKVTVNLCRDCLREIQIESARQQLNVTFKVKEND